MSVKPWDIYAQQLLPIGYGHPLWEPEPSSSGRQVFIGDVGWLKAGAFRALFNSRHKEDHFTNQEKKVPQGFRVFSPKHLSIRSSQKITDNTVFSRSIRKREVGADASAATTGPMTGGIGWRFRTGADIGALLLLNPPAIAEEIESRRHIINYMRENFDSWLEFANASSSWGLDLRPEDIIFVCETVKTTQWAVAAFQGGVFQNKEGYVSGQLGSFGSVGISVHFEDQLLPSSHHRSGPQVLLTPMASGQHPPSHSGPNTLSSDDASPATSSGISSHNSPTSASVHDTAAGVSHGPDQCLFVHYYKMKRRLGVLWKEPMQASAGPHQLPPGPDNPNPDATTVGEGSSTDESEPEFHMSDDLQAYDPVTQLLDYILKTSEADIAIASDLDLIKIFKDREIPSDIAETIVQLSPSVEVDENGVGTISVEYNFVKNRRNRDEQANEDDLALDMPQDSSSMDDRPSKRQRGLGAPTNAHDGSVSALVYSTDGKYLASGSEDSTIIIWDARNNTEWHRISQQDDQGHADAISALAFSRDHMYLASASSDKVIIWTAEDGQEYRRLDLGHAIHSLAYTLEGKHLIGGADSGTLYLWDTETYAMAGTLHKNEEAVTFLVFSPDGRLMATGGMDRVCYIWETANLVGGEPLCVLAGHQGMMCAAAFSPDSTRIITASDDGSSRIWNALTGETLVILHEHTGQVCSVAFSPDGKLVVSGSDDSMVKICDSYSGELVLSLEEHEQDSIVNMVEFSPDGRYIASAASDNTVRLWNASDGTVQRIYNEHDASVAMVRFSPDGSTLTSGSYDGKVLIRPFVAGIWSFEDAL